MKRNTLLKIVNPVLGLAFVVVLLSGFLHGSISHEVFEVVHEGGAILLSIFVVLHIALNWGWIKSNFFKRKRSTRD